MGTRQRRVGHPAYRGERNLVGRVTRPGVPGRAIASLVRAPASAGWGTRPTGASESYQRPRAKSNADANDEPTRSSAKPAAAEAMRRILIDNAWRKMHCKGNPSARGPLARFQRSINKPGWICPSARAILTVFASGRDLGVVGKDNSLGYRL